MLAHGLWRLLEGVNREVRLELALTEWAGAFRWRIGIPGTGNGEHKAHSVSWGNHSVHFWHHAVRAWVSDRLGRWQGENEGLAGQRIWMLFYRPAIWRAFRKGVKWSDAHLRKIALIGREKLGWKGGAMEFSGEAPSCGLSESWCTLSWRSSSGNEEEAWTQSGQDLVCRKPMAMAAEKWGGREGRRELSSFRFLAGQVWGWWYF